jgi:predicted transcriptional regulator
MDDQFSKRERQIMDIIFSHGEATAGQVTELLPDPPASGAVRTMLHILERRGHIKRYKRGREFVYLPTKPQSEAAGQALDRVLNVFFGGSFVEAVVSHLAEHADELSPEEFKRLSAVIRKAKGEGK